MADTPKDVPVWGVPGGTVEPHKKTFNASPAERTFKRLIKLIANFERGLDHEHEIGARLVSFGPHATFHIEDISFWNPDMIIFKGLDPGGNVVELIQNVSQLNVLLTALPKMRQEEEPRRIGFELEQKAKSGL